MGPAMSKKSKLRQLLDVVSATCEDIPDILALQEECFSRDALAISRTELEEIIESPGTYILVCRINEVFAGYMMMDERKFRPWTNGEYLAVRRGLAGRGAAAALVEAGLRLAKRPIVRILVRPSNKGASKLYRRYGFLKAWRKKSFYSDGEDAVVLMRQAVLVRSQF